MKTPTLKQKVEMYETFLHKINLFALSCNNDGIEQLVRNADNWSYSHRVGNGELSDRKQQQIINNAFWKLSDIDISNHIKTFAPVGSGIVNRDTKNLTELGTKLTLIGIENLLPSINTFLSITDTKLSKIEKYGEHKKTTTSEKLKELFNRHGSDKSCKHDYHLVYGEIFEKLDITASLNILEIGLGSQNPLIPSRMSRNFSIGSSIRAYKEFFPNAQIFGADIDKDTLFTEDRIKTSYVDQLNSTTFEEMHKNFNSPSYDLIIEDGLHSFVASLNTLNFALKYTKKGGTIVLEDLGNEGNVWNMITLLLRTRGYNATLISSGGLMLVINI